jgi:hypothetical protein
MKGLPGLYSGISIATLATRASLSGEGGHGIDKPDATILRCIISCTFAAVKKWQKQPSSGLVFHPSVCR